MRTPLGLITPLSLFIFTGALAAAETPPVFDVPRVDSITIDGKAEDWGTCGFQVKTLGNEKGAYKPSTDLDASFRLGWDARGLLVLVNVLDDLPNEAKSNELYEKDSIELFYAPERGSLDVVQMVISPGVDPERPELRSTLVDERDSEDLKKIKVTALAARVKTAGGYTLEVLLPWENLGIKPQSGRELSFQIYVNDADAGGLFHARWYPKGSGHASINQQRLRLSEKPGPAVNFTVTGEYELFRRIKVTATGAVELTGKKCVIKAGSKELTQAVFLAGNGRAEAKFVLPVSAGSPGPGPLSLFVEGQAPQAIPLPDWQQSKAKTFMEQALVFHPSVFTGSDFPSCDFDQPSYVEDLIGPYTISTTFYDTAYHEVKKAEKPGRYGAVVEIKTGDGKVYRRLRTLFRIAENRGRWYQAIAGRVHFPNDTGINPVVVAEQKFSADKYIQEVVDESFYVTGSSLTPAYMAALFETKTGTPDASVYNDFQVQDRQWWLGLKRRLSGADKHYPEPFIAPVSQKGKSSPVIHEGSLKEAGMKPGSMEKIDAVLKEWSANSDEAFAVCVARHGVVVLHRAYGQRDGKPMTVTTKSRMASITKAMSGTAMMMLVDQKLVGLDDPVSKFLPAFKIPVSTPLTIRHLYTHTNGLEGHWGDDLNDFDDLIAGYYPTMAVGKVHEYNGAGLALGSKILESITGETLPAFYKKHLIDPLGCTNTDVTNSSYDASSTPMDIAKFGQMLLNKGSYGNKTFIRSDVFPQMLPERLTPILGPGNNTEWGIGLVWFKNDGLGRGTFGHGAASSATLRIDPENDLVITMTRNAAGANFFKYHPLFLKVIMENLAN